MFLETKLSFLDSCDNWSAAIAIWYNYFVIGWNIKLCNLDNKRSISPCDRFCIESVFQGTYSSPYRVFSLPVSIILKSSLLLLCRLVKFQLTPSCFRNHPNALMSLTFFSFDSLSLSPRTQLMKSFVMKNEKNFKRNKVPTFRQKFFPLSWICCLRVSIPSC